MGGKTCIFSSSSPLKTQKCFTKCPWSKHRFKCHTGRCFQIFITNTSVHSHKLKETKNVRNPLSNTLASCWMSVLLPQNTAVFACRRFLAYLPSPAFSCSHSLRFRAQHRESICYRHKFVWTITSAEPLLLVTGFTMSFLPPLLKSVGSTLNWLCT